jgi:SAM-dependent methyltransferase
VTLRRVERAEELLDNPAHDSAELRQSLRHVAQVNRFLGGTRSLLQAVQRLLPTAGGRILDVGTGSADIPRAIAGWARSRGIPVRVHATDVNPEMLQIAAQHVVGFPEIVVEPANALRLPYADSSFSIALMTLTLHHFESDAQQLVLRELSRVAQRAIVISELERCWPNYLGARFLAATWWRGNRITRHDGPLSVLRAFTPSELEQIGTAAGLRNVAVERRFFYRLLMVAEPARAAAAATA